MIGMLMLLSSAAVAGEGHATKDAPAILTDGVEASRLPAISVTKLALEAAEEYRAGLEHRDDAVAARAHFLKAAEKYEQIRNTHTGRDLLLRNMAQSYLLAGDVAQAIRAYRVDLRWLPHDRYLQAGLAYARDQVAYPTTGNLAEMCRPHERRALIRWISFDTWLTIAELLYFLGWLAVARAWMTRRAGWKFTATALLAAGVALSLWVRWERTQLFDDEFTLPLVVVAKNRAPLHRGNGEDFPLRLTEPLPAGVEMRVLSERGGWLQVQLAGGPIGWIDKTKVVEVEIEPDFY